MVPNGIKQVMYVFASLPVGGAEELVLATVRHLNRKQFKPLVCSLTEKGPMGEQIERSDTEVFALHRMRAKWFDPGIILDLQRLFRLRNVHIVHTHLYHGGLYGRLAARLAGIPCVIATFHNVYPKRRIRHHLVNWVLAKLTDQIIAVSEAVRDDIVRHDRIPPSRIVVLPNALELGKFIRIDKSRARSELGITGETFLIGVIAKLEIQKGHRYLLEALHLLKPLDRAMKVLLLGGGTQEDLLRRMAEEMDLLDYVIFGGVRRDIPRVLSAIDLLILPSLWEGLPIVLLEALAMEVPVVATDVGGNPTIIIPGKTGLLVPPADAGALAGAVGYAMANPDALKDMAKIGRSHVELNFSIESHVAQLEGIYRRVLEQRGQSKGRGH